MNDWELGSKKLKHLLDLAQSAETDFERAAVFAAVAALEQMFDADTDDRMGVNQFDSYAMEKVHSACGYMRTIVGYDINRGHDVQQLVVFALGDISTLNKVIGDKAVTA